MPSSCSRLTVRSWEHTSSLLRLMPEKEPFSATRWLIDKFRTCCSPERAVLQSNSTDKKSGIRWEKWRAEFSISLYFLLVKMVDGHPVLIVSIRYLLLSLVAILKHVQQLARKLQYGCVMNYNYVSVSRRQPSMPSWDISSIFFSLLNCMIPCHYSLVNIALMVHNCFLSKKRL